jgi:hypothetical protein
VSDRRYLDSDELKRFAGDAPQASGERKYLSPDELTASPEPVAPVAPAEDSAAATESPVPKKSVLSVGGGPGRVVMPSEEAVKARSKVRARRPLSETAAVPLSLEETRPGWLGDRPGAVASPVEVPVFAPVGQPEPSSVEEESAVASAPVPSPVPTRRAASAPVMAELSPLSAGALFHLQSRLPETLNILSAERCAQVIEDLRNGAEYSIGSQVARGAESLLYQGTAEGYNFLVKSIRNWRDHWLGDVRTRKDEGRLTTGVTYATKVKHLTNEWEMGQHLRDDHGTPVAVQFYSMRKVSRLGMELGWDLLMERINGVDLSDKRLLASMTPVDKVKVCITMAQAISQLHQRHMIHLDIKPSNFMVDRQGRVRLIDFGISVPVGTQSRTVAGTAGYFSPEQVSCRPLGEDTDVFALGVAFNVIFGGKTLVQTPDEVKSRQTRRDAASDLEKNNFPAITDIPELTGNNRPIADVIRECTVFRRANRISNCTQLISKLRQAAATAGMTL